MNLEEVKHQMLSVKSGILGISVADHIGFGEMINEVEQLKNTPYKWINFSLFTTNELIDMIYAFDFEQQFIVFDDVFENLKAAKKALKMIKNSEDNETLFVFRCKPDEDIRSLMDTYSSTILEVDANVPRTTNEDTICFRWEGGELHPKVIEYLDYNASARRKPVQQIFELAKKWAREKRK